MRGSVASRPSKAFSKPLKVSRFAAFFPLVANFAVPSSSDSALLAEVTTVLFVFPGEKKKSNF